MLSGTMPRAAVASPFIGVLGRTIELVVSFEGLSSCSESMPDMEVQPARHKTEKRATTLGVRI